MIARYILCWLWGAALASGWWASSVWFWGVPTGPNHFPLVGMFTGVGSIATLLVLGGLLIDSAKNGKQ